MKHYTREPIRKKASLFLCNTVKDDDNKFIFEIQFDNIFLELDEFDIDNLIHTLGNHIGTEEWSKKCWECQQRNSVNKKRNSVNKKTETIKGDLYGFLTRRSTSSLFKRRG